MVYRHEEEKQEMKELLYSLTKKDFRVDSFRSGGPGGQHQNKTNSGVRIVHIASGAVGESRESRSQHQNKKIALERLVEDPKFKLWNNIKIHEIIEGKTIEKKVEEMMTPENLKIEIQDDGKMECMGGEIKWKLPILEV